MGVMTMQSIPMTRALRRTVAALCAACALAACAVPASSSGALDAAIAGTQRSDGAKARDAYRHPTETLRFFGIAPKQSVLEIAPGGGWYTDILAPYLHDEGKLYEAQYESTSPAVANEEKQSR